MRRPVHALRPLRRRLGHAAMALGCLFALGAAPAAPPAPDPRSEDRLPDEPPADPNQTPLMDTPTGQRRPTPRRWQPKTSSGYSDRRRVQLTLLPSYAAVALDFVGRPNRMFHGAGVMADVDVQLWRALWLRIGGAFTAHPLRRRSTRDDDDELVPQASAGILTLAGGNVGLAYALDLGRFLALLDAGIGATAIGSPPAIQSGQNGGECREGGACDPGLSCDPDNVCRPSLVPTLSAGLTAEWLVRNHLSLGMSVRYYALLAQPSVFPVYLLVSARIGVRF